MVDQELGKARFELQKGSGDYYTPANLLESIGKKDALEAMVAETGLPLPRVADKAYVLIVTEDTFVADLKTFTNGRQYSIDVVREAKAQKRPPFMVLVNSPVPLAELQKMYPYAGILYIAKNNAEEQAYAKLNPKGTAFTVNLSHLSIRGSDIHEWIGYTLLPRIAQGLTEAKTDVLEAVETIGEEARKLRGEILFAPSIRSYWELARQYYNLQTAFGPMPELIQTGDTALMLACPTGGCFRLDKPYSGGCWSSGNMPDALIEFAIAYRRSIGDDGFKDQLMAYNQGNLAEPWYARTYIYQKAFAGEFKRGLTAPVQKRDDLEF